MVLSKIKEAASLVKVVTRGSLFANTNSAIADLTKGPSADTKSGMRKTFLGKPNLFRGANVHVETNHNGSLSQPPSSARLKWGA